MTQTSPFEITQQFRMVAEKNVEQARAAFDQIIDAIMEASRMWLAAMPANQITSGLKVLQERAIRFTKQNAEACFALPGELAKANNIQDVMAIQSRYAHMQMQAYALQAQELSRFFVEATQSRS
jgi:hypothetical protein